MEQDLSSKISYLATKTGLPYELTSLLVCRGYDTEEKINLFLNPDTSNLSSPYKLANMAKAVTMINNHIQKNSSIIIFGDYDCDGIGASAILFMTLKHLGANVNVFIPSRQDDGYGLSIKAIDRVIAQNEPNLIITVDCGISAVSEIEYIKSKGIDVVLTDHHVPQEVLPDCIIVNPKNQYEINELCGAGVVYFLSEALVDRNFATQFLDICAISTIADLVPLTGDNRTITSIGLKMLTTKKLRPGLKALFKAGNIEIGTKKTSYDVAFKIAPRLNATGRLSNAEKSFKLLVEEDPTLLNLLANEIEEENKKRQDICEQVIFESYQMLKSYDLSNNPIIILYKPDWEGGVIGISASKLTQDFNRPSILFTNKDGVLKGSCRSVSGVNIHEILTACKDYIIQFGGHSMAAGLSIQPDMLDSFKKAVNDYVIKNYSFKNFISAIDYDIEIDLNKIDTEFSRALKKFEPFGPDNKKPIFKSKIEALPFERIGKFNHIKYSPGVDCDVIAFNSINKLDILSAETSKELYYTVENEVYHNTEKAKCFVNNVVVNDNITDDKFLFYSYLNTFTQHDKGLISRNNRDVFNSSENFGKVIITFCKKTFKEQCVLHPTYRRCCGFLDNNDNSNVIIIAPCISQNFTYFDEAIIYDAPSEDYINNINARTVKVPSRKLPKFGVNYPFIDIDKMRSIYKFLYNKRNNKPYLGMDNLLYDYRSLVKHVDSVEFKVSIMAMFNVDLLWIDNGILHVNNAKTDIMSSKVLSILEPICKTTSYKK